MEQTPRQGFFYGWVIVAVATLALVVSNGLSIGGIPVFYRSIREDLVASGAVAQGGAESFIAVGATLTFVLAGVLAPLAGAVIQRFSLKMLMLAGCIVLGGGLLIHAYAQSALTVYFARALMGVSLCLVGVLPSIILVSNWFVRRRGLALGILLTGTSIGGVIVPQIATPLIGALGWRNAMASLSLLVWLILGPAILLLVRNRPSDMGLNADGDAASATDISTKSSNEGLSLADALKTPIFYALAVCAALIFYPIFVTTQQFVLYLQSAKIGMTAEMGGLALSALFFVSISGKFAFGSLSDRLSPTRVMVFCCGVMFLSTLVLLRLDSSTAFLFLIPFGLGYGGAFVLLQRLVADYFGMLDYPKILGVIMIIETAGAAIGGLVTGRLADSAGGDYTTAFYAVMAVTALAFALTISLDIMRTSSKKMKFK